MTAYNTANEFYSTLKKSTNKIEDRGCRSFYCRTLGAIYMVYVYFESRKAVRVIQECLDDKWEDEIGSGSRDAIVNTSRRIIDNSKKIAEGLKRDKRLGYKYLLRLVEAIAIDWEDVLEECVMATDTELHELVLTLHDKIG